MDDERRRQELGKEDDGDSFGANPVDSLRGEGDLTVAKPLDMVVSRREAGDRARVPASWSWRRRAARGVQAISLICSCDSTSKRALERAWSGAADVPRLLLRLYVQESFGALRGHG